MQRSSRHHRRHQQQQQRHEPLSGGQPPPPAPPAGAVAAAPAAADDAAPAAGAEDVLIDVDTLTSQQQQQQHQPAAEGGAGSSSSPPAAAAGQRAGEEAGEEAGPPRSAFQAMRTLSSTHYWLSEAGSAGALAALRGDGQEDGQGEDAAGGGGGGGGPGAASSSGDDGASTGASGDEHGTSDEEQGARRSLLGRCGGGGEGAGGGRGRRRRGGRPPGAPPPLSASGPRQSLPRVREGGDYAWPFGLSLSQARQGSLPGTLRAGLTLTGEGGGADADALDAAWLGSADGGAGADAQLRHRSMPAPGEAPAAAVAAAAAGLRAAAGGRGSLDGGAAKARWRGATEHISKLRHVAHIFSPGTLQGLDVKRHTYDSTLGRLLHAPVRMSITDYSEEQVRIVSDISNAEVAESLAAPRPEWSRVRWVNVQGLSWDVIQSLAVAYDLHPLSVEDIVHIPQRIKADYYQDYLYVSVILVSVGRPSELDSGLAVAEAAAAASAAGECPAEAAAAAAAASSLLQQRAKGRGAGGGAGGGQALPRISRLRTRLQRPTGGHGLGPGPASLHPMELLVEQASVFLFRDGTVLSLFSNEGEGLANSVLEKLKGFKTLLTDSEDASFLFNTILDAVVDHALPVVQTYARRISQLEAKVLLEKRPPASLTKELHLLGNDLKVLRRTLVPTQHLVHKLQSTHYDKDHTQGYLSPLTAVYLSDVLDHISTIVEDMETLAEDARDLIDLVFNTIAHNNNSSMQILATVSTIFLPITFIAGVYGTNFDQNFPEIHWQYGYGYFWVLCVVVTAAVSAQLARMGLFDA